MTRTLLYGILTASTVLMVAGCSSAADDAAQTAASSVSSAANVAASAAQEASSAAQEASRQAQSVVESATQLQPDLGGSLGIDVEVGDCIAASGTLSDAAAVPASCGTQASNYRVIGKAPTNAECVSDADTSYYEELIIGGEQGALCLDVDWIIGECMDVSGDAAQRVPCEVGSAPRERATGVIEGTADADSCPEGGYPHPERQFTVCTETITG